MNHKYFLPIVFLMLSIKVVANSNGVLDTAHYLINNKHLQQAENLLKDYHLKNANDVDVIRLYAQVAYWLNDKNTAFSLFESYKADAKNSYQPALQLDYSRMLFDSYQLTKAKVLLEEYLGKGYDDAESLNMMGTILYWQGNLNKLLTILIKCCRFTPLTTGLKNIKLKYKQPQLLTLSLKLVITVIPSL